MTLHDKYTASAQNAYEGEITDLSDAGTSIRVALLDNAHEPNLSGDDNWDDINVDEITNTASSDTGYDAGGYELENVTWTADGRVMTFDADDVTWASSTIDAGYAVLYDDTPSDDADKKLLTLVDFEGEESSEDGDFSIEWDASGIFQIDTDPA